MMSFRSWESVECVFSLKLVWLKSEENCIYLNNDTLLSIHLCLIDGWQWEVMSNMTPKSFPLFSHLWLWCQSVLWLHGWAPLLTAWTAHSEWHLELGVCSLSQITDWLHGQLFPLKTCVFSMWKNNWENSTHTLQVPAGFSSAQPSCNKGKCFMQWAGMLLSFFPLFGKASALL